MDRDALMDKALVADVVDANLALAAADQGDLVWGHVSLRQDGNGVLMKAAGWGFDEITPERILYVSRDGRVLGGDGRRHIEYPIHTEILAARPDVGAVVHSHAVATASFASLDVPLRPLSHDAAPFVNPDVPRFTQTGDLIRTAGLGASLAAALGDANGVLIPGHGLVTVGEDLAAAVMHAAMLDRACRVQLSAIAAGGPARWSSDAETESKRKWWREGQIAAGYAYLVRKGQRLG
jgi:ribulose-5-phosphate 4-epimerase/fuculose-1-phosphate aldolase